MSEKEKDKYCIKFMDINMKKKIIEIYLTEDKDADNFEIEVNNLEDSEISNDLMKVLIKILTEAF